MSYRGTGDVSTLVSVASAVASIATDPYLPEVVCGVQQLSALEHGHDPGPGCPKIPAGVAPGTGIGLRYAVVPLRVAVKVRKSPWMIAAWAFGIGASIYALGYSSGRRKRGATP